MTNPILPPTRNRRVAAATRLALGAACALGVLTLSLAAAEPAGAAKRIPVIYDSDIGDDIDDTWALGLLLKSPELDLKLVVTDYGKPAYRAKLFAKFLEAAGRADVPVGLGVSRDPNGTGPQAAWVKDYDLARYPGKVHADGVQALIDAIMGSPEPVTLIAVGPLPSVAAALEREPRIAQRARFVGMHGSVRRGYGGSKDISAEWNVRADPRACQKVFAAAWDMTLTPLDTCGLVHLDGDRYRRVRESDDPVARAIIENYRIWSTARDPKAKAAETRSSTLFDTVAVYLAFRRDLCRMERLSLRVDDQGFTRLHQTGKTITVAAEWTHLDGFRDFLVERLAGKGR
ncbi:MAG: nucleoside hydrolase [Verrucomicrobia bacterium]|nr:nucleoside hydrolase [Verrucomicrobiota bacterium]